MAAVVPAPRILIYLLRRDLRLSDNPVLHEIAQLFAARASSQHPTFTHLLPIYVFQAQQVEVSGFLKPSSSAKYPKSPYPEARSQVAGFWRCGPHRAKFLAESVWDLKDSLERIHSGLVIRTGLLKDVVKDAFDFFEDKRLAEVYGVWMTGEVAFEELEEEREVQRLVEEHGREFRLFADEKFFVDDRDLPFEDIKDLPDVYTTFRKSVEPLRSRPRKPLPKPSKLPPLPPRDFIPPQAHSFIIPSTREELLESLLKPIDPDLEVSNPPRWPANVDKTSLSAHPLEGGESKGQQRLDHLLSTSSMTNYKDTRNGLLGVDFSTKLSGYLALGCVTARQIHAWMVCFEDGSTRAVSEADHADLTSRLERWRSAEGYGQGENAGTSGVRFELLWRDYMRLVARKYGWRLFSLNGLRGPATGADPAAPTKAWRRVDGSDPGPATESSATRDVLDRFRAGRSGTGLIDASQRELFLTGYTSNRARQNVASFLAKHLNIDWRLGAEWYECMLVDYDAASNWGNWQYVAGVGNDPRQGRIFNPVKQALDYDRRGDYVKTWVPELKGIAVLDDQDGKADEEALMGVFQAWRLPDKEKERLGLRGMDWAERPLVKIPFSVGRKPRAGPPRARGAYRGRGRGRGWRGRGSGASGGSGGAAASASGGQVQEQGGY